MPYVENKNLEAVDKMRKKTYRNLLIPKVINAIYPKMKYEDYQILKKDSIFLSKVAFVCESCYLDLTKYCNFLGSNLENYIKYTRQNFRNVKSKFLRTINFKNNKQETKSKSPPPKALPISQKSKSPPKFKQTFNTFNTVNWESNSQLKQRMQIPSSEIKVSDFGFTTPIDKILPMIKR